MEFNVGLFSLIIMRNGLAVIFMFCTLSCEEVGQSMQNFSYQQEEFRVITQIFRQLTYADSVCGKKANYYISDSLSCVPLESQVIIRNRIENFDHYFPGLVEGYKPLLKELQTCSTSVFLDAKNIYSIGAGTSQYERDSAANFHRIRRISYSRVYFDESFNKGVLYTSIKCGPECGDELILFVKKINMIWTVIASNTISES